MARLEKPTGEISEIRVGRKNGSRADQKTSPRAKGPPHNTDVRLRADREASKGSRPIFFAYWEAVFKSPPSEVAAASGRLTSRRLSSCM